MLIDLLHNRVRRRNLRYGYHSRFLNLGTCNLHYYERKGSNPEKTLLLLHGLGTSSSTWVHVLPALGPAWNVLAPDLPGFGFSTLRDPQEFFRLSELVDALAAFVDRTLNTPFVIVGHSLGGWLAAKLAMRRGPLVRRLILVNNAGILHEGILEQANAFDCRTMRDVSRLLNMLWLRYPWYFKAFYPAILHDLRSRHVPEFVRSIQAGDFINAELKNLTMPVSILWGTEDRLFPMTSVEIMKKEVPQAEVILLDKCGHVPQLERPKEFVPALRSILTREAV